MDTPRQFSELFILSSPYSGTTAMAKLLMTSERIWSRAHSAEGQQLPESEPFLPPLRWNPESAADWPALKAVWEDGRPAGKVLLEKSHWILLRADQVLEVWPGAFFVISVRHPLAILPSLLSRRGSSDPVFAGWIHRWRKHSRWQRLILNRHPDRTVAITYTSFAREPRLLLDRLDEVFGTLGVDASTPVQVKRYEPAVVSDHDARQIASLSGPEREKAEMLLQHPRVAKEVAFWDFASSPRLIQP